MSGPVSERYRGQRVSLLTKHKKESALGPVLAEEVGCTVLVTSGFDTDELGTFTREVPRLGSQLEAARKKAELAIVETGCRLGLGSEGSFNPGPLGLYAWNLELVVLLDRELGIEIVGRAQGPGHQLHAAVRTEVELEAFAARAGFPEHGLVLRPDDEHAPYVARDLEDAAALGGAYRSALARSKEGVVFVESDLRAHRNPARMTRIAEAGRDLALRMTSACPSCEAPGFGVAARLGGLPCADCGSPTGELCAERWACVRCKFSEVRDVSEGRRGDPGACPECNP
jgi:hypothetical protein